MYGDTDVMRRRATELRAQGAEVRATADRLVAQTEGIGWTGRAAEALAARVHERAGQLRDVAARHDRAAQSLEAHLREVDRLKEAIAGAERAADGSDADPPAGSAPPPRGHKDWLPVEPRGR